jgi:phospholipase C
MAQPKAESITDAEALDRLGEIKHIVVLMMENRSFDHMLGYLQNDGLEEVNGLQEAKPNLDDEGKSYEVFEWGADETLPAPPPGQKPKILDPCHGPECVSEQLEADNTGFVKNFVTTRKDARKNKVDLAPAYRRVPMGYYSAKHLPVYDHLARNFCICDAWHASIPGDTWPNRLYALASRAVDSVGHKPGVLQELLQDLKGLPGVGALKGAPIFEVEAFTRQLHDVQWRWYSHDPATLRAADALYRDFRHLNRSNFAYFNRKKVSLETRVIEGWVVGHDSFLDDAAKGELRDVSWIDPNFIDLSIHDPNSNDDHPPSDVKAGQALVLEIYNALVNSPAWNETMLVIVYDEHGGFYDHVAPPPVPEGDESGYRTLGVRVPALVVGPRVKQMVCHQTFEHTSLIATILRRFATHPEQALRAMPGRVQQAPHLGSLLETGPREDLPDHGPLINWARDWRTQARAVRAPQSSASEAADGTGHDLDLHEFQQQFIQFALAMRESGLPSGQP